VEGPVRKLVVGLGNPGEEYAATRHNVGFRIAERFAEKAGLPDFHARRGALESRGSVDGIRVAVLKPLTFMNRSGEVVARRLAALDLTPANLLVCYDELALPLGRLRLRAGGSSAGHNGMESVIEALGTEEFPRLRFGIQPAGRFSDQVRFVLSPFRRAELEQAEEAIDLAADAVWSFCIEGVTRAMNRFNATSLGTN
jgi:PTH1 family peptidyl-tRNA hydrolase